MAAILVTLLFFIWAAFALIALPERPSFSKIRIWRPRHPTLVILALLLGAIGFYVRYHFPNPNEVDNWFWSFVIDLAPELVGMAFTVVVIDELNQRRIEQEEKRRIIEQMGSPVNDAACEAVRLARKNGWLTDGSLVGADLNHANLENASLMYADLREADLHAANLAGDLRWANLANTDLRRANLASGHLGGATLIGANLWEANLQHTGYDENTKWPEGFDPLAAGARKVRWDDKVKWYVQDS